MSVSGSIGAGNGPEDLPAPEEASMHAEASGEIERLRARVAELEHALGQTIKEQLTGMPMMPNAVEILDAMSEGFAAYDHGWKFLCVNRRGAEMIGRPVEELVGQCIWHLFPQLVGSRFHEHLQRAARDRVMVQFEDADGLNNRWYEYTVHPTGNGVAVYSGDITARKRTEAALQASEARFRTIFELAAVGMAITEPASGRFVAANQKLSQITGYSIEELSKKTFLEITHGEDRGRNEQLFSELAAGKRQAMAYEKRYVRPDGSSVWVQTTISLVRDAEGTPLHSIGIIEDITARKQAESALRSSEERYRTIVETANEGIWIVDTEGRTTFVNNKMAEMCGYTPEELLGRSGYQLVLPEDLAEAQTRLGQRVLNGEAIAEHSEFRLRRKDGLVIHTQTVTAPLVDAQGQVVGLIGMFADVTDRKQAQAALERERERLELALSAAGMSTWEWDISTGEVTWSHELHMLSGTGNREFARNYQTSMASVHPEDLERVQAAIRSSLLDDAPFEAEYRRILPGGVVRWILSKGRTIRDHKGTALKLIGVALDVTDRKRAEEALRESEAQLRHTSGQFAIAVTAMSAIVYDYDPVTDHVERLRGLEEVTGYRPDEVPQTASWWRGQIHPDDRASMDDIDSNQDIKITEYRLRHKQGHYIWVRDAAMLLRDQAGLNRVVGCTVDISEQKRAELALREREEFYRTLGEAVPDFIWSMKADGTATYVNRRWQEYTGLSLEDLTRHNWGSLNHPEDARGLIEDWEHAARRGEPFEAEFRYRRHDGVYRWFMGRSVPLRDPSGQIAQWIGTSTDIHRLKEAETKLRRYNEELEQFAYAAAHDLQEPLRNISIFAQLLSRRLQAKLDDEEKLFLAVVEGGAQRMSTLVQDLLRYTRTLDGPPEVQAVDCGRIVGQVIDSFSQTMSNCGTEIEVMPLPRLWIFDAHLLQLFQNLIGNAIKYRAPETPLRIRVSAERQDDEWSFAVADNGIGIAPEYHERIFGVFRRLHGREVAGTGIGLAICKRIVEHYGGRIWVESQIRCGATFRFTLPAR